MHNKEQAPNPPFADGLGYLLQGEKYMTIQAYSTSLGERVGSRPNYSSFGLKVEELYYFL